MKSTSRNGIEQLLQWLDEHGFYESPASVRRHDNNVGGLLHHSLCVAKIALEMYEVATDFHSDADNDSSLATFSRSNVVIAALLHDLCKVGLYRFSQSAGVFRIDRRVASQGHGRRSVALLERIGFVLEPKEALAIRWHMGTYTSDLCRVESVADADIIMCKCPLVGLIHEADSQAVGNLSEERC